MTTKIKFSELGRMFEGLDLEALEGISIEGDLEFNQGSCGIDPQVSGFFGQETAQVAAHLANLANLLGTRTK
jgi:acetyl-CoA decarbonylase/synthase complex subunit delta